MATQQQRSLAEFLCPELLAFCEYEPNTEDSSHFDAAANLPTAEAAIPSTTTTITVALSRSSVFSIPPPTARIPQGATFTSCTVNFYSAPTPVPPLPRRRRVIYDSDSD